MGKVTQLIQDKLEKAFQPSLLEVRNVSHHHAGHASSPGTGESHFEVEIHSRHFIGKSRVASQRSVYQVLEQELEGPVHALSLVCKGVE